MRGGGRQGTIPGFRISAGFVWQSEYSAVQWGVHECHWYVRMKSVGRFFGLFDGRNGSRGH
jgi:hypothetical protein